MTEQTTSLSDVSRQDWNDEEVEGMSSSEEEEIDRQFEESSDSPSEEDLPFEDPDIDCEGDLQGNKQDLSPARKRARVGSPHSEPLGSVEVGGVRLPECMEDQHPHLGYDHPDEVNVLPAFTPSRPVGIHFERAVLRGAMTTELEFFHLLLTSQMLSTIATHTNSYAYIKVGTGSSGTGTYVNWQGAWDVTSAAEIEKLVALLIYFGLVKVVNSVEKYWSTKSLYHGLWARKILSRDRYKALMAFLHVVDPTEDAPGNKLQKVESFLASFKERCKLMYQPSQNISVDERMVKSKHRSGIKQFMKNKPTKWGLKLWVLADSENGYTLDFNVYIGKNAGEQISKHGLGYDVVMKLITPYLNQGYHVYLDNYYTSPQLVKDLFSGGTPCTGTVRTNVKDFPKCLVNVKDWAKTERRGSMRWVRESGVLALQWIDCKPVSLLTTINSANDQVNTKRREKKDGEFKQVIVPQPLTVHKYNQYMNGVDRSDQMLACHNVSRKCYKWWKTLFFHLIDIAVVNSFLLFQKYRAQHPDVEALKRSNHYSIVEYREALVRQICGWDEYDSPPIYERLTPGESNFETIHMPMVSDKRRNCVICYREGRGEMRVSTYCGAPQCQRFLHIKAGLNCFQAWHSKGYPRKK